VIRGVFFDVGGTLCRVSSTDDRVPTFKRVIANAMGRHVSDFGVSKQPYLWTRNASRAEATKRVCEEMGYGDWPSVYERLQTQVWDPVLFDDVLPVLSELKQKYRLGLLSNTTVWTARDHVELGLGDLVEVSTLSCYVGFAKPDVRIFEVAQQLLGLKASELVYVGDSPDYDIAPALQAGWHAILMKRDGAGPSLSVPTVDHLEKLGEVLQLMSESEC